ncbi:hypothetical protein GCM10025773_11600 [Microbacterium jejuense]
MYHCGVRNLLCYVSLSDTVRLMTMNTITRPLPVGALHMDDDTECTHPESCTRPAYWPGGAPAELPMLGE